MFLWVLVRFIRLLRMCRNLCVKQVTNISFWFVSAYCYLLKPRILQGFLQNFQQPSAQQSLEGLDICNVGLEVLQHPHISSDWIYCSYF